MPIPMITACSTQAETARGGETSQDPRTWYLYRGEFGFGMRATLGGV